MRGWANKAMVGMQHLRVDSQIARQLNVAAVLGLLRARPECRWSYTAFRRVDRLGALLAEERTRRWHPHEGDIFEQLVLHTASLRTPSVIVDRQLLLEVGGFDENMRSGEDYDLWMRLALRSPVALLDEPLVDDGDVDEEPEGGNDFENGPVRPGEMDAAENTHRSRWRTLVFVVAIVGVILLAVSAVLITSRRGYFVHTDRGVVALYQGQPILGLQPSSRLGLPRIVVADLTPADAKAAPAL